MKKSDLKTGMRVVTEDGCLFIVVKDFEPQLCGYQEFIITSGSEFICGDSYNEDLTHRERQASYGIKKVFECPGAGWLIDINRIGKLIWERKAPKEMTVEQIQQALGYKIKIVE